MIFDRLEHIDFYKNLGTGNRYAKAIEWLKTNDLENIPEGWYKIDDKAVRAGVFSYTTSLWEEIPYEAHKKYTDIHYVVSGKEVITSASAADLKPVTDYDPKDDAILFDGSEPGLRVSVKSGEFVMVFPWDAHKPKAADGEPSKVKKIVIKILEEP